MGNKTDKNFTWVIKNFSSLKSDKIYSDQFVIGGCTWRLLAYPKGNNKANSLSLYLDVAEFQSLPSGWKRLVKFSFTIVNQISDKLSLLRVTEHWFDEKEPDWGFTSMFPLTDMNAKDVGFLVNEELKIVAEVDVLQVIGQLYVVPEEIPSLKEMIDVNGFHVLPSQVNYANRLFGRHPDIASNFCIKNPLLRTGYMNLLLSLTEVVCQSLVETSKDDLVDAYAALRSMTDAGFRLDWLQKKLDEISEKKEQEEACATRMQELEEELKDLKQRCSNVEAILEKEKIELLATKAPLRYDDVL